MRVLSYQVILIVAWTVLHAVSLWGEDLPGQGNLGTELAPSSEVPSLDKESYSATALERSDDISAGAAKIKADIDQVQSTVQSGFDSESPWASVLEYNAALISSGTLKMEDEGREFPEPQNIPINSPFYVTQSGSVPRVNRQSYAAPRETIEIISSDGPNLLDSVDRQAKSATDFLNKHTCGGFDWSAQFNLSFNEEALKEYVETLGPGVVAATPMALLKSYSPNLAEIVKHLKVIAAMDLSSQKADCAAIEAALTDGFTEMFRGPGFKECIGEGGQDTYMETVMGQCNGEEVGQGSMDGAGWNGKVVSPFVGGGLNMTDLVFGEMSKSDGADNYADRIAGIQTRIAQLNNEIAKIDGQPADQKQANLEHYNNLVRQRQEAEQQLANLQAAGPEEGIKAERSNGFNTLMKGLLGDVVVSGNAGFEIGNFPRKNLIEAFKGMEYQAVVELKEALWQHSKIIMAPEEYNKTAVADSYKMLATFCAQTINQAWNHQDAFYGSMVGMPDYDPELSRTVKMTLQTLDKMAIMESMRRLSPGSLDTSLNEQVWSYSEFQGHLASYELILGVVRYYSEMKTTLLSIAGENVLETAPAGTDLEWFETMDEIFEQNGEEIAGRLENAQNNVLRGLQLLNAWTPPPHWMSGEDQALSNTDVIIPSRSRDLLELRLGP